MQKTALSPSPKGTPLSSCPPPLGRCGHKLANTCSKIHLCHLHRQPEGKTRKQNTSNHLEEIRRPICFHRAISSLNKEEKARGRGLGTGRLFVWRLGSWENPRFGMRHVIYSWFCLNTPGGAPAGTWGRPVTLPHQPAGTACRMLTQLRKVIFLPREVGPES